MIKFFGCGSFKTTPPRLFNQSEMGSFVLASRVWSLPGGAAGKAANLVGCESPRRQLPDADGEHIRGTAREQTV